MGSLEVNFLGQKYIIKGDVPPEHIREIADIVDRELRKVYTTSPDITPLKAAILAALNIADELYNIKNEPNPMSKTIRHIESKADSIINLFD